VEAAGSSQQGQRLRTDGRMQEVQWLQAADTKQRTGSLETAGKAQRRTEVTTTVQWMEAEAEESLGTPEARIRVGEGQLLLGAAAWVQPVQLVGAASAASVAERAWVSHSHTL
jgi:hypothetical protein